MKSDDYSKMFKEMMGAFPVDAAAMQDAVRTQSALGEKFSRIALDAAQKATEVSARWTRDTLDKVGSVTAVRDEPADYARAMTDFASAQAEMTAESMSNFAEIAKKVQMDTVELMLAAGKDIQEDATAAVKKATAEVTAAAKKATVAAK